MASNNTPAPSREETEQHQYTRAEIRGLRESFEQLLMVNRMLLDQIKSQHDQVNTTALVVGERLRTIDEESTRLGQDLASLDVKARRLEQKADEIMRTVENIGRRVNRVEETLERMEEKIDCLIDNMTY